MVVDRHPPAVLTAEGLAHAYGRHGALDSLDLAVEPGRMLGVIGPNGGGKSTLLHLLAGLLQPTAGRISLKDRPLAGYRRQDLAGLIGLVPQMPELAPGYTVIETILSGRYVRMGGRVFENRADLAAAERLLALTELGRLAHRSAGSLSGGERQRLCLARALAAEPEILLLDEPTSALDLDHQLKTMALLEGLIAARGLTVVLVSHDINLAALFCHRLLLLGRGRALGLGRPDEVIKAAALKEAYGVDVLVDQEPTRRRPRVTLLPPTGPVPV